MPILSGAQMSLAPSRVKVLRLGATRLGWIPIAQRTQLVMSIAGAPAQMRMRVTGVSIRDLLNDAPNTCSFVVDTTAPTVGQDVKIGLGTLAVADLLFAGTIESIDQVYEGGRAINRAWTVTCQDYMRAINKRKVRKRYAQQSATTIALDLIASYTSGFTTGAVVAGLPTVTGGIDFTEEDVGACLTRLAARIGGYWYVDYGKDIHLFLEEASAAPDALASGSRTLMDDPPVSQHVDLSQVRTRVYVEGGGSQSRTATPVGSTTLQVTDASWYSGSGGLVVSGPQRIVYTGKGLVGGPAAPSGSGSLVAGLLAAGPYSYKYTQLDAGVDTPLSLASAPITIASVPDPTSAPSAANGVFTAPSGAPLDPGAGTAGPGPDPGQHAWAISFITAAGETTPGPTTSLVTTAAMSAPGTGPSTGSPTSGGAVDSGSHEYAVTFVTASGETTPGPRGSGNANELSISGLGSFSATGTTGGSMATSQTYEYRMSAFNALGESAGGSYVASVFLNPGATAVQLTTLPVASDARATGRYLYRRDNLTGNYLRVATLNNVVTSYLDTTATASRGVQIAPAVGSVGTAQYHTIPLTAIPTGPAGTTSRKLYRTAGSSGTLLLLATISGNVTTTYTDTTPAASLGAAAPSTNTANMLTTLVTSIPTGPSGTTARHIFRTTAASPSGTLYVVGIINDNSTTTFTDSFTDAQLGAAAPTVNTAGGSLGAGVYGWRVTFLTATGETAAGSAGTATISTGNAALTSIPVSADARVTGRRIYRTTVGGSTYRVEGTINDNTTTTFGSSGADGALGSVYSGVNTAGGGKIAVTGIATGGGGVSQRKLYRTAAGGTAYKLVATIPDNVTATFLDNVADGSLGVIAASDGITQLTGIPASGPGSIQNDILASDEVNLVVQCDDVPAQTALAALDGTDGIVEHYLQDRRLAEAQARDTGVADLALFSRPIITVRYASRDPKTRSGKTIHVNLLAALGLPIDDYTIQSVTITEIGMAVGVWPRYTVEASSVRFSLEDVLRRLQL